MSPRQYPLPVLATYILFSLGRSLAEMTSWRGSESGLEPRSVWPQIWVFHHLLPLDATKEERGPNEEAWPPGGPTHFLPRDLRVPVSRTEGTEQGGWKRVTAQGGLQAHPFSSEALVRDDWRLLSPEPQRYRQPSVCLGKWFASAFLIFKHATPLVQSMDP